MDTGLSAVDCITDDRDQQPDAPRKRPPPGHRGAVSASEGLSLLGRCQG